MGFWNPRAFCPNCGAKIHTLGGMTGKQCPECSVALTGMTTFFNQGKLAPPRVEPGQGVSVRLVDPGRKKISIIKAVRVPGRLPLKDAKNLVDAAPTVIECPNEETAAAMIAEFENHGATYERIAPEKSENAAAPNKAAVGDVNHHIDPAEAIRKLGELHDDGLLTDEEFKAKKAELLDRL